MTIVIGTWGIPLTITIISFLGFIIWESCQPKSSGYASMGDGIIALFFLGCLTIFNLIIWLVWALCR